jgi:hypothetical protein
MLILRDALFFEADEDGDPHLYLAPGVLPRWLGDGQQAGVADAPTLFGTPFGYTLRHDQAARTLAIEIVQPPPPSVRFVFPCRFGSGVRSAAADGRPLPVAGTDVALPAGTRRAVVEYA